MEAQNNTETTAGGRNVALQRFVGRLWHWWNGHHFTGGRDVYGNGIEPECWCGIDFDYYNACWEGWWRKKRDYWRRVFSKCPDCGNRFGDHSGCIPF